MIDKHKENELMWQKLSKIHLNGYVYNYDTEIIEKVQDPNRIDSIKSELILLKLELLFTNKLIFLGTALVHIIKP